MHILLISAAELGFAWDGDERGWVRVSLPPLRVMTGPVQHFRSEKQGFLGGEFSDFHGSLQLLTSSHLREKDKMLLRAILCVGGLERSPSWQGQEGRCSMSFLWEAGW